MAQLPSAAGSGLGQHGKGKAKAKAAPRSGSKGKPVLEAVTLEQFISQMQPLIDLEKVLFVRQFCCSRVLGAAHLVWPPSGFDKVLLMVVWFE